MALEACKIATDLLGGLMETLASPAFVAGGVLDVGL